MSGLFAVTAPESSDTESLTDAALRHLSHYPWLRAVRRVDPTHYVGLGAVLIGARADPGLATSADGQMTLALHGELFDTDAERRRLEAAGVPVLSGSDASVLLAGWQQEGSAFLARLNGEFAAVVWDSRRRELHAITDRFGLRSLFVAHPPGFCAFASEITPLLAVPGVDLSWSEAGVTDFFAFGYFVNDNTLLRGVRAVPAATVGTFRLADGTYQEHAYWRLRPGSVQGSAADLASAFEERFIAAVARRARPGERLGLSLSGGLDARTILGAMPAGIDLQTVSLGIDGSLDHRSASEMARLAGTPHHQFVLGGGFLSEFERHLREIVRLTDGHYLDQGIVMPTMPLYRERGIEFLMRGHGGELLHMTKAYAFSLDEAALRASERELEAWLLSHLTNYMLAGVPDDLFTIELRAGAAASLRRALDRCQPTERPVDLVWQLFLNERLHRETTLSMHTFENFVGVRQPYLDNDLIDAIFSLPAEMKMGDELQAGVLRRVRPAFLNVINANTGTRMGAGPIETAFARLRLKVGAKLGWKGYQPYERLGLWLKHELRGLVESVVTGERLLESGLLRPDVVRRVVDRHMSGQANHTFLLMSLTIFGLGQEERRVLANGRM